MTRPGNPYPGGPVPYPYSEFEEAYVRLRQACIDIEELMEEHEGGGVLTEKELKRLDKGVTVMKVGFKLIKKAIKARSLKILLKEVA